MVKVWEWEDGIVVWGTHNGFQACSVAELYLLRECGLSIAEVTELEFMPSDFTPYWGSRKLLKLEQWPENLFSRKWRPFWVPYMVYSY